VATDARVATSDIDANARGAAAIAFTKAHGLYLAIRRPGRRDFASPVRISGRGHALVYPAVRVNPAGDVLVAWISSGPYPRCRCRSPRQSLVARMVTAAGRITPIERIGPGASFQAIALAFADDRRALVGWQHDGASETTRVAYASTGGRWHRAQIIDSFSGTRTEEQAPPGIRVGFASDGTGEAVWDSGVPSSRIVRAAELTGTSFGPPHALSAPAFNTGVESLGAGPRGEIVATWTEGIFGASKLFAAARARGAQWGPAEFLATNGAASHVAIDPVTGVPLAVFVTNAGAFYSARVPVGS
jgi:hypothetical protein